MMAQVEMQISKDLTSLVNDKRIEAKSTELPVWDQLTLAQEFSACSLGQFGYQLSHIEQTSVGDIAVLTLNGKIATISENGYINVNPSHYS